MHSFEIWKNFSRCDLVQFLDLDVQSENCSELRQQEGHSREIRLATAPNLEAVAADVVAHHRLQ